MRDDLSRATPSGWRTKGTLRRGWALTQVSLGPNRTRHQVISTIRTDANKDSISAVIKEGALKGTDAGMRAIRGKIPVTSFAAWPKFEHADNVAGRSIKSKACRCQLAPQTALATRLKNSNPCLESSESSGCVARSQSMNQPCSGGLLAARAARVWLLASAGDSHPGAVSNA
ncbi:MAG: hypothetical protein ACI841_004192 [Planctomycetota bacterium]|jgi:hypothetical protein